MTFRFYLQSAARFYRTSYPDIEETLSGDVRHGRILDHSPGARVERAVIGHRGGLGTLGVEASNDLSLLEYPMSDDALSDTSRELVSGEVTEQALLRSWLS